MDFWHNIADKYLMMWDLETYTSTAIDNDGNYQEIVNTIFKRQHHYLVTGKFYCRF